MFVKPASTAVKVRDPRTKLHLPEAGAEVPDGDPYWTRRILDGDVVEVKSAAKPPPAKAAKE